MAARLQQEFAAFLDPGMEAACVSQGRCRIRIRARGLAPEIAGSLRLPGCRLDEAADENEAAVYLFDCLPDSPTWSERTQAELTRRFEAWRAQFTVAVSAIECRSARCRVLLSFENAEDAERLRNLDYYSAYLPFTSDHGGALSGFEPAPDGTGFTMIMVIERGDQGWTTQTSAYEYQRAREQRVQRLRSEARDDAWASKTEALLNEKYEGVFGKGAVKGVECRTSRCQVALTSRGGLFKRPQRQQTREILQGCRVSSTTEEWEASTGKLQIETVSCSR